MKKIKQWAGDGVSDCYGSVFKRSVVEARSTIETTSAAAETTKAAAGETTTAGAATSGEPVELKFSWWGR